MHDHDPQTAATTPTGGAVSRRDFVARSALALAAWPVAASPWANRAAAQSATPHYRIGEGDEMKTRMLGSLEVSELGFGSMGLSGGHCGPGVDRRMASV
jgi:hypothetical protein